MSGLDLLFLEKEITPTSNNKVIIVTARADDLRHGEPCRHPQGRRLRQAHEQA